MATAGTRNIEVAIPAAALTTMRHALEAEVGADGAARAIQQAGNAAGDSFFQLLSSDTEAGQLSREAFWMRLNELFAVRGWGQLAHEEIHPGVGALDSVDWAEADLGLETSRPSCFFATGLLANLLGRAAGDEVAVLEVECRSRGDRRCRFLFGAPATLNRVYQDMGSGRDADTSIAELR